MDKFVEVYDKEDSPEHGIFKIWLKELADALGYKQGTDCNGRPYYRVLHEMTNEYLVEDRDFITVKVIDNEISYHTRFYNKDAFLLIAMVSKKQESRNWLEHERLMCDHHAYMRFCIGRCCTKLPPASSVGLHRHAL